MRFQRAQMPGAVVVVTGASSGIGRAIAIASVTRGARGVLTARSAGALAQVARQCGGARPRAEAARVCEDVTDEGASACVAHLAIVGFGHIDVWVDAAGIGVLGTIDEVPYADPFRAGDVNAWAAARDARAALPYMRSRVQGVLIDVSSVLGGVVQAPCMGVYAASEAALTSLDETLRQELPPTGARGIAVCTVLPAGVGTPFFTHVGNRPGRRLRALPPTAAPERVARAVVRTAAHPRRRVLVGPGARILPWSHAVAPRLVGRAVAWRTEHGYLDAPDTAPDTTGTLYEPCDGAAAVHGGAHASLRALGRRAAAATVVGAAGVVGGRTVRRRRRPRSGRGVFHLRGGRTHGTVAPSHTRHAP
ncbi:SDR family NAD(P)-dependent oxidoreductase [Streptomyces sp. NPDC004284]|uniref:SDR family NAD(P)-dependent oxidoreductase n=1 Tax=Streptomyces sp. NPDC004284 TaxID=3364695 RepID=UPI00367D5ED1